MGAVWTDHARFERMLEVELAVCRAQVAPRARPGGGARRDRGANARVDVDRIAEIEATTDHDVIAFVSQVAETVGPDGRYLHLGLTSSDVVDTGLALQLRAAGERLLDDADALVTALIARARAEAGTVMMGRTHSVHAEPTTFGLKCAGWAFEVARGRERLAAATDEIATGKISGPVGTYSHLPPDLEAEVLADLGLHADPVSTQIVQRDRHAAFLAAIAILGGTPRAPRDRDPEPPAHRDRARSWSRSRRARRAARRCPTSATRSCPSGSPGRRASSAATRRPRSRTSRCGTSATSATAPPSGSILPDATILLDYMLVKATGLVEGLVVRPERMRENIERGLGLHASSRVLRRAGRAGGDDAARTPTRSCSGPRSGPPTSACRCASLLATDPAVAREAAAGRPRRLLRRRGGAAARARGHRPPGHPRGGDPGSRRRPGTEAVDAAR